MHVPQEYAENILHAPPPDWVTHQPIDLSEAPSETERARGGIWNLLSDTQHNLEEKVNYWRIVRKLATQGGVQDGSRFQIHFSPHLHQLVLHTLVLHREGQPVDLLEEQNIQVLNREAQMELDMFGGYLTAVLLLRDTRVGDAIEFSYSIRKLNTLVTDRSCDTFVLKGGISTKLAKMRLLYAPGRQVFALPINHDIQPTAGYTETGLVDCQWQVADRKPFLYEPDAPSWFMPPGRGVVEYGEFSSWNEVAHWVCRLFYQPTELSPEFYQIVQRIAGKTSNPVERIGLALRFVQDDIRYVSVSIGEHSFKPYDIATILQRRYGDCKDKASLLSFLLRELGIDALPALVHHSRRQQVIQSLPSPFVFNHVIVRVRLEGVTYWYDGTISGQRGAADAIYCPAYGKALVVLPETQELEDVVPQGARQSTLKIIESFKIHQLNAPAEFSVSRIYEGSRADAMRQRIANSAHEEVEREFRNAYFTLYPHIKAVRPWNFQDDEVRNRLEISLEYEVGNLWKTLAGRPHDCAAYFYATGIYFAINQPPQGTRKTPYAITHPNNIENELIIRTTRPLKLARGHELVESKAFRYKSQRDVISNSVHFTMQYSSHKDHVLPTEMNDYLQDIKRVMGHVRQGIILNTPQGHTRGGAIRTRAPRR